VSRLYLYLQRRKANATTNSGSKFGKGHENLSQKRRYYFYMLTTGESIKIFLHVSLLSHIFLYIFLTTFIIHAFDYVNQNKVSYINNIYLQSCLDFYL